MLSVKLFSVSIFIGMAFSSEQDQIPLIDCGIELTKYCSPEELNGTTVIFYSRNNTKFYSLDKAGANEIVNDPYFDKTKQTILFVHGFTRSPESPGSVAIKDAFLLKTDTVNYFAVNATEMYGGILNSVSSFMEVAPRSVCLGRAIAKFLFYLNGYGVNEENIYLIGHSLGAPTVSYTARDFFNLTGKKVSRITALDSAAPCFYPSRILQTQPGDAKAVDAIHTNMNGYGTSSEIGHADFYPNGGSFQPKCMTFRNLFDVTCSHSEALFIYAESINSKTCIGARILSFMFASLPDRSSTTNMGYYWSNQNGSYYLSTNAEVPYCRAEY